MILSKSMSSFLFSSFYPLFLYLIWVIFHRIHITRVSCQCRDGFFAFQIPNLDGRVSTGTCHKVTLSCTRQIPDTWTVTFKDIQASTGLCLPKAQGIITWARHDFFALFSNEFYTLYVTLMTFQCSSNGVGYHKSTIII